MIYEHSSLPSFMKSELELRARRNPVYSSNAFARDLGLSPAFLSLILSGRRKISVQRAHRLARALKLSADETSYLMLLVQEARSSSPEVDKLLKAGLRKARAEKKVTELALEHFRHIADWQSNAILEGLALSTSQSPSDLSKRFGIPLGEVKVKLDRLKRLGLIRKIDSKFQRVSPGSFATPHDIADRGLKRFHSEVLRMAAAAVEKQDVSERHLNGLTLALDSTRLPEIKKRIREFFRELDSDFGSGTTNEVYQLSLALFKPHHNLTQEN